MTLYIALMRRWGSRETHSYVQGVYSTRERALESGLEVERDRAGKYRVELIKCELDVDGAETVIRPTIKHGANVPENIREAPNYSPDEKAYRRGEEAEDETLRT